MAEAAWETAIPAVGHTPRQLEHLRLDALRRLTAFTNHRNWCVQVAGGCACGLEQLAREARHLDDEIETAAREQRDKGGTQ